MDDVEPLLQQPVPPVQDIVAASSSHATDEVLIGQKGSPQNKESKDNDQNIQENSLHKKKGKGCKSSLPVRRSARLLPDENADSESSPASTYSLRSLRSASAQRQPQRDLRKLSKIMKQSRATPPTQAARAAFMNHNSYSVQGGETENVSANNTRSHQQPTIFSDFNASLSTISKARKEEQHRREQQLLKRRRDNRLRRAIDKRITSTQGTSSTTPKDNNDQVSPQVVSNSNDPSTDLPPGSRPLRQISRDRSQGLTMPSSISRDEDRKKEEDKRKSHLQIMGFENQKEQNRVVRQQKQIALLFVNAHILVQQPSNRLSLNIILFD